MEEYREPRRDRDRCVAAQPQDVATVSRRSLLVGSAGLLTSALISERAHATGTAPVSKKRPGPVSQPRYERIVFEKDVPIATRDGNVLLANVYRPDGPGRFPVIMASAPYEKDVFWSEPENLGVYETGGDAKYLRFELPNPGFWCPRGYVFIHYQTRGFGGSTGYASFLTQQEVDTYDAVEWAGTRPWSSGNVALMGVSYYAMNQYAVAGLKPPHLKAILPWEGWGDLYRDVAFKGGIPDSFVPLVGALLTLQWTNPLAAEPPTNALLHPLYDDYWKLRSPDLSAIDIPMFAVGQLADVELHLRGDLDAFIASPSPYKKLLLHAGTHWTQFYLPEYTHEQLRFLDYWLKDIDTGIYDEPPITIEARTGSSTHVTRTATEWPPLGTRFTRFYLHPGQGLSMTAGGLNPDPPDAPGTVVTVSTPEPRTPFEVRGTSGLEQPEPTNDGVHFTTPPLTEDLEITGPVAVRLWVSATAGDFDIIAELRDIDPSGKETRFAYIIPGAKDYPVTKGWLRVSHRKLDKAKSTYYRPYHTHDELQPIPPGEIVPVDVELLATSMIFKRGHRIQLSVRHNDYQRGPVQGFDPYEIAYLITNLPNTDSILPHIDTAAFAQYSLPASTNTIYTGGDRASYLLLPVQPR